MNYLKFTMVARDHLIGVSGQKIWRFVLCVFLSLLLAQTAGSLTWKIVGLTTGLGDLVGEVSPDKSENIRRAALPLRVAVPFEETPLFGKAEKVERSPAAPTLDATDAPKTTLELVLMGIITAEPKNRALAIIVEKGKNNDEKLYGIGDKVPGNAIISEIFADRLILRRGGVFETLMLQEQELTTITKSRAAARVEGDAIVNLGDGVHWEIDNAYLNQRLNDISSLAREVGVEVYKEDNVQKGYRLVSARGSRLLRDMGLQPGDILHEVNGVQLDTIQAGLAIYQQMRNAQQISVVISRNGRRETRIYEINNGG